MFWTHRIPKVNLPYLVGVMSRLCFVNYGVTHNDLTQFAEKKMDAVQAALMDDLTKIQEKYSYL